MLFIVSIVTFIIIGCALSILILIVKSWLSGAENVAVDVNGETKDAQLGDTLLTVLLTHDIKVPSPCGGKATCKQCKVQVLDNSVAPVESDKATFTRTELQEGWRLSCQTKVRKKIKVKVPESCLHVQEIVATVLSNCNVSTYIKELVVKLSNPIDYKPGAYLQCIVPAFCTNTSSWGVDDQFIAEWDKYGMNNVDISFQPEDNFIRAYSLASYPAEGDIIKFNVRIASPPIGQMHKPWGVCSSYIFSLKKDDTVKLAGPYGESFMKDTDQELIFLIGGAGSSFARSHIMHLFRTERTKRKVTLWYGARSLKENIYQKDFSDLDREFDNFTYNLVLSTPGDDDIKQNWPINDKTKTGYVFQAFEIGQLKKLKEPDSCLYYVCGPPLHNISVIKLLDEYGVYEDNIVLDDFGN